MVCIVTYSNDLHALAIQRELRTLARCECHILPADKVAQRQTLSLHLGAKDCFGSFLSSEGVFVPVSEVGAVWLRRPNAAQLLSFPIDDSATVNLIDNDCTGGLKGVLVSSVRGKWISSFDALIRASDKISQLQAASDAGFRIPETLVTQSKAEVTAFQAKHKSTKGIIVKTVVGGDSGFLLTRQLDNPDELSVAAYEAAPAIYQESIPGRRHIRMLCFGSHSLAAVIDSSELDWRPNLNVPVLPWTVPDFVHKMTRLALDQLGLEMGVIDLKETTDGQLVWLEVNPQGQFLFLEPLTQIPFARQFSDYLAEEALAGTSA